MRAPTPMPPRALRAPGAYRREPASRTSTLAIAALGPACAARGACAREMGPSEAKARGAVWMFGSPPPAGCACGGAVVGCAVELALRLRRRRFAPSQREG